MDGGVFDDSKMLMLRDIMMGDKVGVGILMVFLIVFMVVFLMYLIMEGKY